MPRSLPAACRPLAPALLAVALLAAPRAGSAQDQCPSDGGTTLPPDYGQLVDFFPGDNATGVPLDGFVRLRYRGRAPRPPVVQVTREGEPVAGAINVIGTEVHWQAQDRELAPNTRYRVRVADVSGGTGDNVFGFTTGVRRSTPGALEFAGVAEATSAKNGASDLCGDPDAVEITLSWRRAGDNGWPPTEIEYAVFQTRGPGIAGPVERARERGRTGGSSCGGSQDLCRSFRLTSENASGPVCFNVQALDPYGRADGNAVERCVDPSAGNFFVGCAAPPRPRGRLRDRAAGVVVVLALAVALMLVVRRGRRA